MTYKVCVWELHRRWVMSDNPCIGRGGVVTYKVCGEGAYGARKWVIGDFLFYSSIH